MSRENWKNFAYAFCKSTSFEIEIQSWHEGIVYERRPSCPNLAHFTWVTSWLLVQMHDSHLKATINFATWCYSTIKTYLLTWWERIVQTKQTAAITRYYYFILYEWKASNTSLNFSIIFDLMCPNIDWNAGWIS
jgi:hypothetical protein